MSFCLADQYWPHRCCVFGGMGLPQRNSRRCFTAIKCGVLVRRHVRSTPPPAQSTAIFDGHIRSSPGQFELLCPVYTQRIDSKTKFHRGTERRGERGATRRRAMRRRATKTRARENVPLFRLCLPSGLRTSMDQCSEFRCVCANSSILC